MSGIYCPIGVCFLRCKCREDMNLGLETVMLLILSPHLPDERRRSRCSANFCRLNNAIKAWTSERKTFAEGLLGSWGFHLHRNRERKTTMLFPTFYHTMWTVWLVLVKSQPCTHLNTNHKNKSLPLSPPKSPGGSLVFCFVFTRRAPWMVMEVIMSTAYWAQVDTYQAPGGPSIPLANSASPFPRFMGDPQGTSIPLANAASPSPSPQPIWEQSPLPNRLPHAFYEPLLLVASNFPLIPSPNVILQAWKWPGDLAKRCTCTWI